MPNLMSYIYAKLYLSPVGWKIRSVGAPTHLEGISLGGPILSFSEESDSLHLITKGMFKTASQRTLMIVDC